MAFDATTIPPQTVELRHTLPDGSSHIDWMLDLAGSEDVSLTTFRLASRVDDLAAGASLEAVRIADHRRVYLTYEGAVSGERGSVQRVAAGRIEAMQSVGDAWGLLILWQREDAGSRRQRLQLRPIEADRWRVTVL